METLRNNKADITFAVSYVANYYLSNYLYESFTIVDSTIESYRFCIAVSDSTDEKLLSIINKSIQMIKTEEIENIIISNSIYNNSGFGYFIHTKRDILISSLIVFILCISGMLLIMYKIKNNKASEIKLANEKLEIAIKYTTVCIFEYEASSNTLTRITHNEHFPLKITNPIDYFIKNGFIDESSVNAFIDYFKNRFYEGNTLELKVHNITDMDWIRISVDNINVKDNPLIIIIEDSSAMHKIMKETTYGYMTNIPNRKGIIVFFENTIDNKIMILFDIDYFKQIYDNLGHQV